MTVLEAATDSLNHNSTTGETLQCNAGYLCLMSPVFATAICGPFKEARERQMVCDHAGVLALIGLAQGKQCQVHSLQQAAALLALAERYDMRPVHAAIEQSLLDQLTVDTCVVLLCHCAGNTLAYKEAYRLACSQFLAFSLTPGFLDMHEDVLRGLLADDALAVDQEEEVLAAALLWRQQHPDSRILEVVRGDLLQAGLLPHGKGCRHGMDLCWTASDDIAHGAHMLCPTRDGCLYAIHTDSRQSLYAIAIHRESSAAAYSVEEMPREYMVACLAHFRQELVYGCLDGRLRFHPSCDALAGHTGPITCVTACNEYIVSGSEDGTVRICSSAANSSLVTTHTAPVTAVLTWGPFVISASKDKTIVIQHHVVACNRHILHTLASALAACGRRLFSTDDKGTIYVWDLKHQCKLLCTVQIQKFLPQATRCTHMTVCGSQLVCGGLCAPSFEWQAAPSFLLVLNMDSMTWAYHQQWQHNVLTSLVTMPGGTVYAAFDDKILKWCQH